MNNRDYSSGKNMKTLITVVCVVVLFITGAIGYLFYPQINTDSEIVMSSELGGSAKKAVTVFDNVVANGTTTSGVINLAYAKKATVQFSVVGSGQVYFDADVSVNGDNYIKYNRLVDNLTNSNSQTLTRVNHSLITTTDFKVYDIDLDYSNYDSIKFNVGMTGTSTDTYASTTLLIQY